MQGLVAPEDVKHCKDDSLQGPWPTIFPGKWKQNFICVASLDQRFSVCHTSHSGGSSIAEWHLSVLPWWRIWGGSYSPANVTAIITVISLLSSRPAIGIDCSPCLLIVHALTGTKWKAVWSQLITGMEGCHSLWLQHECLKDTAPFAFQTLKQVHTLAEVEPLRFTNPIMFNRDLARALMSTSEPPCCLRRLQSAAATIPSAEPALWQCWTLLLYLIVQQHTYILFHLTIQSTPKQKGTATRFRRETCYLWNLHTVLALIVWLYQILLLQQKCSRLWGCEMPRCFVWPVLSSMPSYTSTILSGVAGEGVICTLLSQASLIRFSRETGDSHVGFVESFWRQWRYRPWSRQAWHSRKVA